MAKLGPEDLFRYLAASAGEGNPIELAGSHMDTPFDKLGYDSLVLIETAARIKDHTGLQVDDEALTGARTPRELLVLLIGEPR